MSLRGPLALAVAAALATAGPVGACATASTGARCVAVAAEGRTAAPHDVGRRVPARLRVPAFAPGDTLPEGRYRRLIGTAYYGLPPVVGDWRYYEVDGRILRVVPETRRVVGDATDEANGAF